MIEAALYIALGALSVSLLLFAILPIVSGRARRLAINELERQAPVSLSEITAQKDQMRARFAVDMNRQEKRVNTLQDQTQQHLIDAERWRAHAQRVEVDYEKLADEYAGAKKRFIRAEEDLQKQKEIAKSALKTPTGKDKKMLLDMEEEVEQLRAEKSLANTKIVSLQTKVSNAQSRVAEMERMMPSLEELDLRKELKVLAQDVSRHMRNSAPAVKPARVSAPAQNASPSVSPSPVRTPASVEKAVVAEQKPVADAPAPRKLEIVSPVVISVPAKPETVAPDAPQPAAGKQAEKTTDASESQKTVASVTANEKPIATPAPVVISAAAPKPDTASTDVAVKPVSSGFSGFSKPIEPVKISEVTPIAPTATPTKISSETTTKVNGTNATKAAILGNARTIKSAIKVALKAGPGRGGKVNEHSTNGKSPSSKASAEPAGKKMVSPSGKDRKVKTKAAPS